MDTGSVSLVLADKDENKNLTQIWKSRTELLLGRDALSRLEKVCVAVIGLGGVGAAAAEMLARSGVGHLVLVDCDEISESNINRQLPALHSTVGKRKCRLVADRLKDINPALNLTLVDSFLDEDCVRSILGPANLDYVVDAIDTLSPKIALVQYCLDNGIPLVSSMGSGAKLDVTKVRIDDISRTKMCPLAAMLRKRLHKLGIYSGFKAVYSEEAPQPGSMILEESRNKRSQVGSAPWLPSVFGCACAQTVVSGIVGIEAGSIG